MLLNPPVHFCILLVTFRRETNRKSVFPVMMFCLLPAFLLALVPAVSDNLTPVPPAISPLDSGFHQMYNLQFAQAHLTFRSWEQDHPEDPMGPTSEAAAFLFCEFDRLGVLQAELFVDDRKLWGNRKLSPDADVKAAFDRALASSDRLADATLVRSPQDVNALFAKSRPALLRQRTFAPNRY